MRVTEQIDALEANAVDAFHYLVATRVVACAIAMPLLTILMDFAGIFGGYVAEAAASGMSWRLYFERSFTFISYSDLLPATLKTVGVRLPHRHHLELSRLQCHRRHRGRGRGLDAQRRAVLDPHHPQQRHPGADDLLLLPPGGSVSETEVAHPARSRVEGVQRPRRARRRVARCGGRHRVLPARAQRHRQERHAAPHHRPCRARRGACVRRGARRDAPVERRPRLGAQAHGVSVPERGAVRLADRARERRVPAAAAHRPVGGGHRGSRPRSARARSGWNATSTRCRASCLAACASASGWRAPWRSIPASCWWTSRAPDSIRSPPARSTSCCSNRNGPAPRWSSSRTTSQRAAGRRRDGAAARGARRCPGFRRRPRRQRPSDRARVHAI